MATTAQLNACAANAQHSTGPTSPEGKAASSRNALKLGLYAQADILPGEDPAALEQLTRDFEAEYDPQGTEETRLLHDLVRAIWLERRYTRIETEVINVRYAALPEEQRQFALGAIYIQDAEGPNLLPKIERRRAAARRQADRARAALHQLHAERRALEPEPANPNPINPRPVDSVRFSKPVSASSPNAAPVSVPAPRRNFDINDNPALRL